MVLERVRSPQTRGTARPASSPAVRREEGRAAPLTGKRGTRAQNLRVLVKEEEGRPGGVCMKCRLPGLRSEETEGVEGRKRDSMLMRGMAAESSCQHERASIE